jgi:hypothetical protein
MQGEDDLRGLAKIMAFMRAVSILLVLMHLYWFCYGFFMERGWTLELINKILGNFNRTAGLFEHTLYTKVFALVLLALSCLGTKGVKDEKITVKATIKHSYISLYPYHRVRLHRFNGCRGLDEPFASQ